MADHLGLVGVGVRPRRADDGRTQRHAPITCRTDSARRAGQMPDVLRGRRPALRGAPDDAGITWIETDVILRRCGGQWRWRRGGAGVFRWDGAG
jgi:hypothetical protein